MIEVQQVSKEYGSVHAVRGLTFAIEPGQCVGLLGPNGAGKSTTIRMIAGYIPPSAGRLAVGGFDTVEASLEARRVLGYLPESTPLYTEMRVVDLLKYRTGLFGMSRAVAKQRIGHALELCRVQDVARRRIGQLSKGYKQRVGLAMALVHDPKVLVLDEPTSGLDPTQIRETRSLIKDLAHQRTVLVSSHILPEIEQTCDRVLIMARGRLKADGSPRALTSGSAVSIAEFRCDRPAEATARVRAIPNIGAVETQTLQDSWVRLRAAWGEMGGAIPQEAARERIAAAVGSVGGVLRELRSEALTLEQVFVRLIESDDGEDKSGSVMGGAERAQGAAA